MPSANAETGWLRKWSAKLLSTADAKRPARSIAHRIHSLIENKISKNCDRAAGGLCRRGFNSEMVPSIGTFQKVLAIWLVSIVAIRPRLHAAQIAATTPARLAERTVARGVVRYVRSVPEAGIMCQAVSPIVICCETARFSNRPRVSQLPR